MSSNCSAGSLSSGNGPARTQFSKRSLRSFTLHRDSSPKLLAHDPHKVTHDISSSISEQPAPDSSGTTRFAIALVINRSAPLTYPQEGTHVSPTVGTPRTMVRYGYGMHQSPKQDLAGWTVSDASQDDPWSFVSAVWSAERVLTNTFHGLTFSILLHKDFAVPAVMRDGNLRPSGSSTSKVWDLLRAYNLTDRLMDPRTGAWPHRPVHWQRLDHALRKDIRHSLRRLHSAVERVGKKGHAKDSYVTVRR